MTIYRTSLLLAVLSVSTSCVVDIGTATPADGADAGDGGRETPAFFGCDGDSAAHDVFNDFWKTLDTRYAVFDFRLGDRTWAEIGHGACSQLSPDIGDAELYDLLLSMARELDDTHVTLTADDLGRDEDAEVTLYPNLGVVDDIEDVVEARYLDGEFARGAEGEISWGTIGDVGYISITSMDELSAGGDDEDLDVEAAAAAMRAALADLGDASAIIVDVRANGGGWDAVSLEIAAWFAGPRAVAWTEQMRNGPDHDDFGASLAFFVDATRDGGFAGPVVVLTSGATVSAAETFVLAMRVRDNVTITGERTSGHLSDMIDGELPNGWEFTYSGERYTAADGVIYEGPGIPADIDRPLNPVAIAAGSDPTIEAVLAML